MAHRTAFSVLTIVSLNMAMSLVINGLTSTSGSTQTTESAGQSKTADETFKNIQVLKGIKADDLMPAMQFISGSLGVECNYCHVEEAFEKDDKKTKQTARKMIEMTVAINRNNFEGQREVTCNSCHRGSTHPVNVPVVKTEEAVASEPEAPIQARSQPMGMTSTSAADAIIGKYIAATGGPAAIQKVTSRVEKGVVLMGGRQFPIEIYTKAPDKLASVMHLPNGDSSTVFDGKAGWLSNPGKAMRTMNQSEIEDAQFDADMHLAVRLKEIFDEFEIAPPEKIAGRQVISLVAMQKGKPPARLYFDQQSLLLVRVVRYSETPLGRNPIQIDYADYRKSSGVKIPYRRTIARPSGSFTIQVNQVQQNIPIDGAKFSKPKESERS